MPKFGTTARLFGGYAIDRSIFRELQKDSRWLFYAAGWVNPNDGNVASLSLVYEKDDGTQIVLGTVTETGATRVKTSLGPFDLFATAGVPKGETIPVVRLRAVKDAGVDGEIDGWCLWLRLLGANL